MQLVIKLFKSVIPILFRRKIYESLRSKKNDKLSTLFGKDYRTLNFCPPSQVSICFTVFSPAWFWQLIWHNFSRVQGKNKILIFYSLKNTWPRTLLASSSQPQLCQDTRSNRQGGELAKPAKTGLALWLAALASQEAGSESDIWVIWRKNQQKNFLSIWNRKSLKIIKWVSKTF